MKGIDVVTSKTTEDPEKDFLSQIIAQINSIHGKELSEQDRLDLEQMKDRIYSDKSLQSVMLGDNSEMNKKQKFDDVLDKTIMSFFNERFDFFKKVDEPKLKSFISQMFYDGLKNYTGGS